MAQEHRPLLVRQSLPQLGGDLAQVQEHPVPQRLVAFDEIGGGAQLGIELARGGRIGRGQRRSAGLGRGVHPRQHAVPRGRDDLRALVPPPQGGRDVDRGQARADQQHISAGRRGLQRLVVPGIVLDEGLDRLAAMEQQRPRPGDAGRQHQHVRRQPLAVGQAQRPTVLESLGRQRPRAHHPRSPQAWGAVLQTAQPLLQIVAIELAGGEIALAPARRARVIGVQPVEEALGRSGVQRHVAGAGVEQMAIVRPAVGRAPARLGVDQGDVEGHARARQGVGEQYAARAGADDDEPGIAALDHALNHGLLLEPASTLGRFIYLVDRDYLDMAPHLLMA